MNEKSLRLLEFDKVLARLASYTSFSGGAALAQSLRPTLDMTEARRWQAETREALQLLNSGSDVTIGGARDVRPAVDRATHGFTLLAAEFIDIRNTLVAARTLKRKLEKVAERYPALAEVAELIEECPGLVTAIGNTLDERGEVLDSASVKLTNLRRELRVAHGRIQDKLRALINDKGPYLQEPLISLRNGRYVVPVRAESRGNVKGIVHDQSGSGATYWIEPLNTVELNNDYRNLQIEEEKEVQRILAELSNQVADQSEPLMRIVDRMAEFDLIFARAKYAQTLNAIEPEFVPWRKMPKGSQHPGSTVWVRGGRHPLLNPATVIPTNWTLDEDTFLVLITGPNTGGKTVSLKTMGLMVLMAQAGMHVPATEARLTLFDRVFADIGDEQSIEQSLSTFSAHMTNIITILDAADDRSLVLLDELGSGTDPAEGAALAQAILNYLRDKGATCFIATHYPELKAYAMRTGGATNASLLFDLDTLSPTYELTIGLPGKSNALAIARRLGLENSVLDDAMRMLGSGSNETENLLDSIYDMREKIASEEASVRLNRMRLERERERLQQRLDEIEPERQRILDEARAEISAELTQLREEIQQVRRKLTDANSRNTLKQLGKNVDAIEERPREAFKAQPLAAVPTDKPRKRKLKPGDSVFIKPLGTRGEVISVGKKDAEVAVGRLHMKASLDDLEFKGRAVESAEEEEMMTPSSSISTPTGKMVDIELDIRGQRIDEGLANLDKYLDEALLGRLPWVRIIHGKGTGRLREAVRQALDKNQHVLNWEEGQDGEGGPGVTVARLEAPES